MESLQGVTCNRENPELFAPEIVEAAKAHVAAAIEEKRKARDVDGVD